MNEDTNPPLDLTPDEARACRAEIEFITGKPLPDMVPTDTYHIWLGRPTDTYKRLVEKLRFLRYGHLTIVVRDIRPDFIMEVHLYADARVELWDCTYEVYGVKPYCFKSYYHTPVRCQAAPDGNQCAADAEAGHDYCQQHRPA